jgi:hypothetical protein
MADPKQLDWCLLKELECPVCLEYMESPIKLCENGHNICDNCRGGGRFRNVRLVEEPLLKPEILLSKGSLLLPPYIRARTGKLAVKRLSQ